MRNTLGFIPHTIFSIATHHKWASCGWMLPDRGSFLTGGGVYLHQIWTTATQLTKTDYNSRQLIKSDVLMGNVTQAVVMSCG